MIKTIEKIINKITKITKKRTVLKIMLAHTKIVVQTKNMTIHSTSGISIILYQINEIVHRKTNMVYWRYTKKGLTLTYYLYK